MKLDRHQIAEALEEIATLMELSDENPFKVRAYRNAARTLEGATGDFEALVRQGRLEELQGIGKSLAAEIGRLARAGESAVLKELRSKFPASLLELFRVPGVGPKKIKALYDKLGVRSLGELEYACQENRLVKLAGFGARTQEKILEGIAYVRGNLGRFLFADVVEPAEALERKIGGWKEVRRVALAGSYRRRKETLKDLDVVCASESPRGVMERFAGMEGVERVAARGDTKSSVVLRGGLPVDLRVVSEKEFPYALLHFTGSKEHNTAMRARAKEMGCKLNEYGLFRGTRPVPCRDEAAVFRALKLTYIPPELREDQGEIAWSEEGKLPELIGADDLRGVFHVHTEYSDGRSTMEELVAAASGMGIEYLGISDHSQTASYANGLREADLERQRKEIAKLQKKFPKPRIFQGVESDILPDGSLDYPDRVLAKLDFVIASVHAKFNMTEEEMTRRCLRALEHPRCTMLGHPTGRLLLAREGFKIDLHRILDRAAELGRIVELNANAYRLDLDWRLHAYAKEKGVRLAINPDAHSVDGLGHTRFGINAARKGGLTKGDIFNTAPLAEMEGSIGARA